MSGCDGCEEVWADAAAETWAAESWLAEAVVSCGAACGATAGRLVL